MLDRRRFVAALAGSAVLGSHAGQASAAPMLRDATLRGGLDATELGLRAGRGDDQSAAFSKMLRRAADRDEAVWLPAGTYVVSNIVLPRRVRLAGVPGASRILYGGDGFFLAAEGCDHLELDGLTIDGADRWLDDRVRAALDVSQVGRLAIANCDFAGSARHAIACQAAGGRIAGNRIAGAADAALYSLDATGLDITGNTIRDCGNGGILVHRGQAGEDGTVVSANRVERIAARNGGTGPFGNGINIYRAAGVIVSDNRVTDCAFSAIRSNGGSNIQISGNSCLRSGETAIYSEFAFEGAAITGNIVDGAANGISIVNFNEGGRLGVCCGNLVRNLSTAGPYPADSPGFGVGITVEADTALTGNVVENAPRYGLHLGWGPYLRNVTATGNVIRRAGTGIAVSVVEGAGAAIISDNVIAETPNGAVVGHRWADPATGDLARSGSSGFAHLTVERNHLS